MADPKQASNWQKSVADFTFIWTAKGLLCAAAVLILYSCRIVGWLRHRSVNSHFVANVWMMAVWQQGKPVALLRHVDHGSQYTSEHFQKLLKEQVNADVFDYIGRFHAPILRYSNLDYVNLAPVEKA